MKIVTLEPVKVDDLSAQAFKDVHKFTKQDYEAVHARGPVKMPLSSAMEAIRNSRGLYKIRQEQADAPAQKSELSLPDPETMNRKDLFLMALGMGLKIAKPNIKTDDLRRLVVDRMNKFVEAEEEGDDEPADD